MNPVIGDKALNGLPKAAMTEVDKVRCHLSFALQQLQKTAPPTVPKEREELLAALEEYMQQGNFPRNENGDAPDKRFPCFIDGEGTLCAVAHLMHSSEAAALAKDIAATHKYDTIDQIAEDTALLPEIQSWATANGIELSELALIQPTYEFVAKEAREKFAGIEKDLRTAAISPHPMIREEIQRIAQAILDYGQTMGRGYGYPQRDIPQYQTQVTELGEIVPEGKIDCRALVELLGKEVEGSQRGGKRTEPDDYEGYVPEYKLRPWRQRLEEQKKLVEEYNKSRNDNIG